MNRPEIQSVTITLNPVNQKQSIKVSVTAVDKEIVFQTAFEYAKEIYAGEQIGVI